MQDTISPRSADEESIDVLLLVILFWHDKGVVRSALVHRIDEARLGSKPAPELAVATIAPAHTYFSLLLLAFREDHISWPRIGAFPRYFESYLIFVCAPCQWTIWNIDAQVYNFMHFLISMRSEPCNMDEYSFQIVNKSMEC
jgi:hypothetical protein